MLSHLRHKKKRNYTLPFMTATEVLLSPVISNDAVITLHEFCDRRLVVDRPCAFQLELTQAHLSALYISVDNLGDAGIPAVARRASCIVEKPLHR